MKLDDWSAETVRAMVRYIKSDERIARHCKVPIEAVQRARRVHISQKGCGMRAVGVKHKPVTGEDSGGDGWMADARRASDELVEALSRARRAA